MWLYRLRRCLLEIRVRLLALDEEIGRRIFEPLVEHSRRWRSVDFAVPHHCDEEFNHKIALAPLNAPIELPSLRWASLRRFQEPPICLSYAPVSSRSRSSCLFLTVAQEQQEYFTIRRLCDMSAPSQFAMRHPV